MKSGWMVKRIGEVCTLMTGGTPSRDKKEYFENGNIKWLVSGDIHSHEITDCEGRITQAGMKNSNAKLLPINSVMIALNGQGKTRGTVAILRTQATCNQSLVSIYPKNPTELLPEFIYFNLYSRYEELRKMTGDDGNDRRGLNMLLIRDIQIPLPPLAEQQRIVALLDQAFAAIDQAKANVEKNIQNTRELFETFLGLTFVALEKEWDTKKLGDVCQTGAGGTPLKSHKEYYSGGNIPWLLSGDVSQGEIFEVKQFITELGLKNSSARIFPINTILVAMYGATAGQVGIIRCPTSTNQAICGILPNNSFIPEFMYFMLQSKKSLLVSQAAGNAQPNISQIKIKNITIPIVPIEIQQEFVWKLTSLSKETNKLEDIYQKRLLFIEELGKTILKIAFTGELTKG